MYEIHRMQLQASPDFMAKIEDSKYVTPFNEDSD